MQVRKQQLEWHKEQQSFPNRKKEYIKAVYCHPAYLILFFHLFNLYTEYMMRNAGLDEAQAGISPGLPGEI